MTMSVSLEEQGSQALSVPVGFSPEEGDFDLECSLGGAAGPDGPSEDMEPRLDITKAHMFR